MTQGHKVFRSRISILLIVIILMTYICILIPVLKNLSILAIVLISIVFIPVVFILTGIRYLISDNKLYLKLWKFKIASLNIYEIYSIQRSYNPLSSPAASIKRLKISLIKDFALISPVDEKKFIEELISINPDIKINVSEKNVCIRFWDWDI